MNLVKKSNVGPIKDNNKIKQTLKQLYSNDSLNFTLHSEKCEALVIPKNI